MQRNLSSKNFWRQLFSKRLEQAANYSEKNRLVGLLNDVDMHDYQKESCKYTDLARLGKEAYKAPREAKSTQWHQFYNKLLSTLPKDILNLPRIVCVNGDLQEDVSTPSVLSHHFSHEDIKTSGLNEEDPFYLLNVILRDDAYCFEFNDTKKNDALVLISLGCQQGAPVSYHPHYRIKIGKNTKLNLLVINAGEGHYFHNPVMDISLDEGAHLEHVTIQKEASQASNISAYRVKTEQEASYKGFIMGLDANLSRFEQKGDLSAKHGNIEFNGLQYLGETSVGDMTSVISHHAPQCVSRQYVRNVADDEARCVFQGSIYVQRGASQTDGGQLNQNLLLSPKAQIDTKPQLEIYAEDVSCNHGATIGELDGEALFYLQARGISYEKAREMLVEAFLEESLSHISQEIFRELGLNVLKSHHGLQKGNDYES